MKKLINKDLIFVSINYRSLNQLFKNIRKKTYQIGEETKSISS